MNKISSLLVAAVILSFGAASAQPAADKVRVALFASVADGGLYAALEKGFFKEQNLDVEFVRLDSAGVVNTALASGHVDVAGASLGAGLYNAIRQGVPLKIVADKGQTRPGFGYMALVVRNDVADQIKTPADLRGRPVAITSYNSGGSNEIFASHLLEQGNLKVNDVRLVNIPFGDIIPALSSKRVEVGFIPEPMVTASVEQGVAKVWKRADAIYPSQQFTAIVYGPGMINRPDVGRRFMVANLKGVRFYNDAISGKASRAELIAILSKHTSVKNPDTYRNMVFPGLDTNGHIDLSKLENDMQRLLASGSIKEPIDLKRAVDQSYVTYAIEQLKKEGR